jgi:hypothetical protein
MCATILVQILYLTKHVLQFTLQSRVYVCIYVHTVQSSQYDSQIEELLWHGLVYLFTLSATHVTLDTSNSPYALCRFRLPTQPTNTFQLKLAHTAAATANALCCYMLTFKTTLSEVYPHASKSCLGKQGTRQTWLPGLLCNISKGLPGRMVKPSTDFIQLFLNEHMVFWIFVILCSSKYNQY